MSFEDAPFTLTWLTLSHSGTYDRELLSCKRRLTSALTGLVTSSSKRRLLVAGVVTEKYACVRLASRYCGEEGRKHRLIVSTILRDVDQLKDGAALKVPLADLSETKENVRSALNRATRKPCAATATSFLYIWNADK